MTPNLTVFQGAILHYAWGAPNHCVSTWQVALHVFGKQWARNRSGHGAMIGHVDRAFYVMTEKGLGVRLTPHGQWDEARFTAFRDSCGPRAIRRIVLRKP